jgi:hypothetical protein
VGVIGDSSGGGNTRERTGGRSGRGRDIIIGRTQVIRGNIYLMKYK